MLGLEWSRYGVGKLRNSRRDGWGVRSPRAGVIGGAWGMMGSCHPRVRRIGGIGCFRILAERIVHAWVFFGGKLQFIFVFCDNK